MKRLGWVSIFLIGSIPLCSCWREDGFLGPGQNPPLDPLVHFSGSSVNQGDTALGAVRLQHLSNPKVVVVWQFLGLKRFSQSYSENSVGTEPPYTFAGTLKASPPSQVFNSPEAVIGAFWLYSDKNRNGRLDRLVDPAVNGELLRLDTLQKAYQVAKESLLAVAEVRARRQAEVETYFVGAQGAIFRKHNAETAIDTVWPASPENSSSLWWLVLDLRSTLLSHFDKWEEFFQLRKPSDATLRAVEDPKYPLRLEYSYHRKLYPREGAEETFERRLKAATSAYYEYYRVGRALEAASLKNGWVDYPFSAYASDTADWVAGQSRWYYVLYLPDEKSLREIQDAEASGNYRVEGIQNVKRGYNLLYCSVRRDCKVLPWTSPVTIDLGQSAAYFSAETPEVPFVTNPVPVTSDVAKLTAFQGTFEYLPLHPVRTVSAHGELWVEIANLGTFQLLQADSVTFFSPVEDIQLRFARTLEGPAGKMLVLSNGSQTSMRRIPADTSYRALMTSVESIRATGGNVLPISPALAGKYEYGSDTVSVTLSPQKDSAYFAFAGSIRIPAVSPVEGRFVTGWSDFSAREARNELGVLKGLWFSRNGREVYLPRRDYAPRLPAQLFPSDTTGVPWTLEANGGSGRDTYRNVAGAAGFSCSTDGRYLRQGDGILRRLDRANASDSISWTSGDSLLLQVPAVQGKRIILRVKVCMAPRVNCATTSVNCADRVVRAKTVLLSAKAGVTMNDRSILIAEEHWRPVSAAGNEWELGPFPAPADTFFVSLRSSHTAQAESRLAIDGYQILREP